VVEVPRATSPACRRARWSALEAALEPAASLGAARRPAPALPALRAQLRALLHYHLGTATLRTRQVMLDLCKTSRPHDEPLIRRGRTPTPTAA
jgi:hypothetical protein